MLAVLLMETRWNICSERGQAGGGSGSGGNGNGEQETSSVMSFGSSSCSGTGPRKNAAAGANGQQLGVKVSHTR